jgi:hypothetical protein
LENALTQLNDAIRNKISPMEIMMIVHMQVHPNLLQTFGLGGIALAGIIFQVQLSIGLYTSYNVYYYNYGFSKSSYLVCMECHDTLFGQFRIVDGDVMEGAYESILEVINDMTEKKGYESIDYYEAVRIAYTNSEYMQKYIDSPIKDITEINKGFRCIWEFTYRIVNEEKGTG